MTSLTRDDIIRTFGEVDDSTIADIIGTGATIQELAEAQTWIANNEAPMNSGRSLAAGRVGRLVEILGRIAEEEPGPAGGGA
jgi:hypothetical protein